uniref:Axoneme-associated protein mst101, putative n=1 Tax=Entamoeba invadens TaxID=33085 RepID=S0B1N6_ENTIV|nr:axoneme-associated protein mst101, putative [Entamoeba invadens]
MNVLLLLVVISLSKALVTEQGHSPILAANLVTTERDSVELSKRIQVNEDRERLLNDQLQMHYRDLRLAANPTTRAQLERGIESILSELKVLRAASRKFLDKLRLIADGLVGVERNEFIRKHRLERFVGESTKVKTTKILRQQNKEIRKVAKKSARKYGKIAAKAAGKKAAVEAKKKFGEDKQKIKMEKKKAEKSVYKKAFRAIMNEVKSVGVGMRKDQLENKSAEIVLNTVKSDNPKIAIDPKEMKKVVSHVVKSELKKNLSKKEMKELSKSEKAEQKEKKAEKSKIEKKKKSKAERKAKRAAKKAEKKIQKQTLEVKRQEIKMQRELNRERMNSANAVRVKKAPKIKNPVRETKRAIEKTVDKVEKRAKREGLKPMKHQLIQRKQLPDPFEGAPTVRQLEIQDNIKQKKAEEVKQKMRNQLFEPQFETPQQNYNPTYQYGPMMGFNEQRAYMDSLFQNYEMPPVFAENYQVDPMVLDNYYGQLLM